MRFYKRFIDDIFIVFAGTQEDLHGFHEYLNSCNEHLRFILTTDNKEINFLDTKVVKDNNNLTTDLLWKPTDRNTLLRCDFYHPTSLKKGLLASQVTRIRRIGSSDQAYKEECQI